MKIPFDTPLLKEFFQLSGYLLEHDAKIVEKEYDRFLDLVKIRFFGSKIDEITEAILKNLEFDIELGRRCGEKKKRQEWTEDGAKKWFSERVSVYLYTDEVILEYASSREPDDEEEYSETVEEPDDAEGRYPEPKHRPEPEEEYSETVEEPDVEEDSPSAEILKEAEENKEKRYNKNGREWFLHEIRELENGREYIFVALYEPSEEYPFESPQWVSISVYTYSAEEAWEKLKARLNPYWVIDDYGNSWLCYGEG